MWGYVYGSFWYKRHYETMSKMPERSRRVNIDNIVLVWDNRLNQREREKWQKTKRLVALPIR
jgi:hypothetical protein